MLSYKLNRLLRRLEKPFLSRRPLPVKIKYDCFDRPHFAFGMFHAAYLAKSLGHPALSAVEFGVAGGNGLVTMEHIASEISRYFGIRIEVYGFDMGEGQPSPIDYRDSPYIWRRGQFKMDVPKLQGRLKSARLIIGDAGSQVGMFRSFNPSPIGFVSFDMDYYSSTVGVWPLFGGDRELFLPRVFCYFDDIIGHDNEYHSRFTGELLAIDEFNSAHQSRKFAPINGLAYKRVYPAAWNHQMYVLHMFDHAAYNSFVNPMGDMQRPLL